MKLRSLIAMLLYYPATKCPRCDAIALESEKIRGKEMALAAPGLSLLLSVAWQHKEKEMPHPFIPSINKIVTVVREVYSSQV